MKQLCAFIFLFLFGITQVEAANIQGIEQELSDSVITAKITAQFTSDPLLNPLKISVATEKGKVTLNGHVKNKEAFVSALKIVSAIKGVRYIDTDHLEIKQVNTVFTDAYITAKVEAAVLKAKVLDDESIPLVGISASTENGVVTISGKVKSSRCIDAILKRVSQVKGVKQIISDLKIGEA